MRISIKCVGILLIFFICWLGMERAEFMTVIAAEDELDLGIAPSYDTPFDAAFDFNQLADAGFSRVNLYYTWKEFEIGAADPNHPEGTIFAEEVDPVINTLESLGMRASLIIEIAHTDCGEEAPPSCWLEHGIQKELLYDADGKFVGFDADPLASRLVEFVKNLAQRYPPKVVTHVLVGNETDQFLRLNPQYYPGYLAVIKRIQAALNSISNRARFGTIFTFAPRPGFNDWATELAAEVDVMAFTIYPTLDFETTLPATPQLIDEWFGTAQKAVGGRSFVVTETGYPAQPPFGTPEAQKNYTEHLLNYLNTKEIKLEFISWWSVSDSTTHPEPFYQSLGLLDTEGNVRPALDLWLDATSTPPSPSIPSDVNSDGVVNIFDLVLVASQFGQTEGTLTGDVNGDGQVNIFDLVIVASNFGR